MKTTLTIEESARLIELGVDPKLASETILTDDYNEQWENFQHPIFGLIDILSILPKMIDGYHLNIDTTTVSYDVAYVLWDDDEDWEAVIRHFLYDASAPELIDALYQLLIWCLEQEFCKRGKGGEI